MSKTHEHIVIGAGIVGSASAYHLSKSCKDVLLIEQFSLPNTRGGSHGQSRGIRCVYTEEFYIKIVKQSFVEWSKLEEESGQKLFHKTGRIYNEEQPHSTLKEAMPLLDKHDIKYEELSYEEMGKRYPQAIISKDSMTILETECGVLRADRCLKAFQNVFERNGGTIIDECKVLDIIPGDVIQIETSKEKYFCKNLSICTGAWSAKVLEDIGLKLPIQPLRVISNYWKEKNFGEFSATNNFPCWRNLSNGVYLLPSIEYPGHVKMSYHYGEECDPDNRDLHQGDKYENEIIKYIQKTFPTLVDKPSIKETCMYAQTPDSVCFLDHHPKHKNIVIATGFSGNGFKKAPVMGKLVSEMARGVKPHFDVECFSLKRFL